MSSAISPANQSQVAEQVSILSLFHFPTLLTSLLILSPFSSHGYRFVSMYGIIKQKWASHHIRYRRHARALLTASQRCLFQVLTRRLPLIEVQMDRCWAQALQGGGREARSPLYQTHTSYRGATWGGELKVQLMGKASDFIFSFSQAGPPSLAFITLPPPSHPHTLKPLLQCQQNWGWECGHLMKNNLLNGSLTWKEECLSADLRIYHYVPRLLSENELISLISQLLVTCYPQYAPAECSFTTWTCHWIKTIKLQRAPLQRCHFDEGTVIPLTPIRTSSLGLNTSGKTVLSCTKLSQTGEAHLIAWNSWSHTKYHFPWVFACRAPPPSL